MRWFLAAFLWALSTLARAADCSPVEAFARGFVLHSTDGRTDMRVRQLTSTEQEVATIVGGKVVNTMVYRDGLFPLSADNENGLTTYEYPSDVSHFKLQAGSAITYSTIVRTPGKPDYVMSSELKVISSTSIEIGKCTFSAVHMDIKREYTSGKLRSSRVAAFFSPDLHVPLRTRTFLSDGSIIDFTLSGIEPTE